MKRSSLVVALILSVSTLGIYAGVSAAQSEMKPVSESRGLFTVSFPADWRVLEVPRERIGATLHLPAGTSTDNIEALMIVTAPDDDPGCFVWLEALRLQRRITPMDVWVTGGNQLLKGFAEHKTLDEGIEHVGDREVYYNKFTWKSDAATGTLNYSLMEVLVADTTGYLFVGTVPNDPGSIEKHMPVFANIMGTLAPNPAPK